ncbi:uncharacterized protein LOC144875510 [Branchiostoma floridae x Branchiostoma japonicum]
MALVVSLALLLPTSVKPAKESTAHTNTVWPTGYVTCTQNATGLIMAMMTQNATVQADADRHVEYTSSTHAPAASTEEIQIQEVNRTITNVTFGGHGSKVGRLSGVSNAAVSPSNEVFVADTFNRRVQVFNMEGVYLRKFPTVVSVEGSETMNPYDMSIDGKGHLWVIGETVSLELILVRYTKTGRHIITIHPPSLFTTFNDIAVDTLRNHVIVIAENAQGSRVSREVMVLLYNGTVVRKFETRQGWPSFITVDRNGRYLVTVWFPVWFAPTN